MTQLKSFDVEIVASGDDTLTPSALVVLSLLDISLADAPAISLAELRLRCGGRMPINLQLNFDLSQIDPRHTYTLAAQIEKDGQLLYINTTHHLVDLNTLVERQRVTVEKLPAGVEGIHGGNLTEGIHGGNRID
ncbi:YbaY family lipoprotein [Pseudomonas sp. NPDC089554]|uniref:YbaY family lipoprotein n=1 Tax=Pseudomonas sp. NPDC089554 TaxID=3390653 RepID=UPI003D02B777